MWCFLGCCSLSLMQVSGVDTHRYGEVASGEYCWLQSYSSQPFLPFLDLDLGLHAQRPGVLSSGFLDQLSLSRTFCTLQVIAARASLVRGNWFREAPVVFTFWFPWRQVTNSSFRNSVHSVYFVPWKHQVLGWKAILKSWVRETGSSPAEATSWV